MKHINLTNKWLCLMGLMSISLGCEKSITEQAPSVQTPVVTQSDQRITKLVERAYQPGTQEDYEALTASYKALTFDELELFNKLKTAADSKRVEQKLASSGARMNAQQLALVTKQLEQISSFRSDINQQSMARYGIPYNQLDASALSSLLDEQGQNNSFDPINLESITNPNARASSVQACSAIRFPSVAVKVNDGTQDWTNWGRRSTPGHPSDCDYEYKYRNYWQNFDPKDWFADQLCKHYNNRIARRYDAPYSYLLFGNRGVLLWIGYPGLLSVEMTDR